MRSGLVGRLRLGRVLSHAPIPFGNLYHVGAHIRISALLCHGMRCRCTIQPILCSTPIVRPITHVTPGARTVRTIDGSGRNPPEGGNDGRHNHRQRLRRPRRTHTRLSAGLFSNMALDGNADPKDLHAVVLAVLVGGSLNPSDAATFSTSVRLMTMSGNGSLG